MGMFDSVYFRCPNGCEGEIEVQSKAGRCCLASYDKSEVPIEIANDINGEGVWCQGCHTKFIVETQDRPPATVPMRLIG